MKQSIKDKEIHMLRELARKVADIASSPVQKERIRLWEAMNSMRPERPLVAIYPERAWKELIPERELFCEHPMLRQWELALRRMRFHHEYICDDRPIHGELLIKWVIDWGSIGVESRVVHSSTDGPEAVRWDPPISSIKDLDRLRFRKVVVDKEVTFRRAALAQEVFDGIIPVTIYGGVPFWSVGVSMLIQLRGLERAMVDMYEQPEIIHAIMSFLRDDRLQAMDTLESERVLSVNDKTPVEYFIGSGHEGYTTELPAQDFRGDVRWKDMWGLGEMQEFSGVGPEQFDEFSLQYQIPILNKFGLVSYGCCEPLDKVYDLLIDNIPHLRRVSVTSPYADKETAAEKLECHAIFAWKPNPAALALPDVDWEWIERDARETLGIACSMPLEIIMKSTETFSRDTSRLRRWVDLMYECIGA